MSVPCSFGGLRTAMKSEIARLQRPSRYNFEERNPAVRWLGDESECRAEEYRAEARQLEACGNKSGARRLNERAAELESLWKELDAEWEARRAETQGRIPERGFGLRGICLDVSPEVGRTIAMVDPRVFPAATKEFRRLAMGAGVLIAEWNRLKARASHARTSQELAQVSAEVAADLDRARLEETYRAAIAKAGEGTAEESAIKAAYGPLLAEIDKAHSAARAAVKRARLRLLRGTLARRVAPRTVPAYTRVRRVAPRRTARGFRAMRRASAVVQKAASGGGGGDDGSGVDPAPKAPAAFSSARRPTFASVLRTVGGAP